VSAAGSASVTEARQAAPSAAGAAWLAAASLARLHLRSRRVPSALGGLAVCGAGLWAALSFHWWLGTGPAASELPMIIESGTAAIIAVTTHSPFGEPERATGRWLPFLRLGMALALCGAARRTSWASPASA
jgi:hypothetical protein